MESFYKCVIARAGTVTCWDTRPWDTSFPMAPAMLDGVADARGVAGGSEHLCVLSRGGTVQCVGNNMWGQLGNGGTDPNLRSFVAVRGLVDAVAISNGESSNTVALRADGTVAQWGNTDPRRRALAPVPGLRDIVDISIANGAACARRADSAVFCWGNNNYDQLANGTGRGSETPVRIPGFGP